MSGWSADLTGRQSQLVQRSLGRSSAPLAEKSRVRTNDLKIKVLWLKSGRCEGKQDQMLETVLR
jgi:hypothetical protein